jgi:aspartate racemase
MLAIGASKLQKMGADFVICPTTRCTRRFRCFAPRSPLPWLHIAEVVAAQSRGARLSGAGAAGTSLARAERGLPAHYPHDPLPAEREELNRDHHG